MILLNYRPTPEHEAARKSKVSSESVNEHGPSHVRHPQDRVPDPPVDHEEGSFNDDNDEELEGVSRSGH